MPGSLPSATNVRPALVRLIDAITKAISENSSEIILYVFILIIVALALFFRRHTWF